MPNFKTPDLKKPNSSAAEIKKSLTQAKKILINMDTRFDYDALCSTLAFDYVLNRDFKKQARLIYSGLIPESAKQFYDYSKIEQEVDISSVTLEDYDLVIFLDSGDNKHTSTNRDFVFPKDLITLNIDHHISNDSYGSYNYVNFVASNCTNLGLLFEELSIDIDYKLGDLLVLGLITDSGFFQFQGLTSQDFMFAAMLKELKVDFYKYIHALTFNESYDLMKARELVLSRLVVPSNKNYAYSFFCKQDYIDRGIDGNKATIPPADVIKRLDGVDFVMVISEKTPGKFSVSFRSHEMDYDVSKIASALGGGGHIPAAAAPIEGEFSSVEEAVAYILPKIDEIIGLEK